MIWSFNFISSEILNSALFGSSDFFKSYQFDKYLESRFKLNEKKIRSIQFFFFVFSIFIIGFQLFIVNSIALEVLVLEIFLIFIVVRMINYITFLQFKDYSANIETIGYFVVNELLIILDTSHSLKEATQFVISSNFP
ncbi:MAG: hypothetical protein ACW964_18935, partial [Candidatus Hodarchaeales archaeon]